ncbi:hypothetical protein J7E93_19210 [Streptomyces sp. ISL-36]|uniref:hypothetical protein n=1 Tax=Streptomyces sp. ISL-36 TaxID=2819182 RepID=UPI001BE88E85|nr:hypothetical protein [Streptomyces sp. ISL-36]MBT2442193.1 hypothetical protein [Streptomyces sp. ISL-36]
MSMWNARRWCGQVALLLVVASSATACSGDEAGKGGEDAATQASLKTCESLLGAENVASVRADLGGDVRAESSSPERAKGLLLEKAEKWTADGDDLKRATYQLCLMRAAGEEDRGPVVAGVKWSLLTMDWVSKGKHAAEWRKAAEHVYVQRLARNPGLAAVVPCTLPGTAPGQTEGLPLEISVLDAGLSKDSGALSGRLLSALVRKTHELLGCQDSLAVPESLTPEK